MPGVEPPTAHLETDAALALIVFVAVVWFGIRSRGLRGYAATFAEPSILMIPLNLVETITRTFSLVVRLFGNVMSGVFVVGIVLSLVGLLVPVPLMALDLLTGAVQAYIFSVLAMVFIAGVLGEAGRAAGEATRAEQSTPWTGSRSPASWAPPLPCPSVRSGRRSARGAPWPPPWMRSHASPKPPARSPARLFVGLAMIETMAIYCLVIALLLLFANPFVH